MIKAHLTDKQQTGMKAEEDLWKGEEAETKKPSTTKFQKIVNMDLESKGDDDDDDSEDEIKETKQNQKGKKLHRGSLMPSGGHISWKAEIEKIMKE